MENKTAIENELQTLVASKVWAMIDDKLQECKLIRHLFTSDENGVKSEIWVELPDGTLDKTHVTYQNAYHCPEGYERNECVETNCFHSNDIFSALLRRASGEYFQNGNYKFYTCFPEYGEPTEHELKCQSLYFDYQTNTWHTSEIPSNIPIYKTKEKACSYSIYEVVNENGEVSERVGINRLLRLDEDQKKLINRLEDLLKELKEHDVYLLADTGDNYMAYNKRNVEDINLSYNDYPDLSGDKDDTGYEEADRYGKSFIINASIPQWSEDYNMFVKRKK